MEKKKHSSKIGVSPKPKKRIQKSKSTNWEAEGDEVILVHDDISSTSPPGMGMGENGFSHHHNGSEGLFEEALKGDDIMALITNGKNSVRDRKHSFSSLYLHKKGREKSQQLQHNSKKEDEDSADSDGGGGGGSETCSSGDETNNNNNKKSRGRSQSSLKESMRAMTKEERRREKEAQKLLRKRSLTAAGGGTIAGDRATSPFPFRRKGLKDAFTATKSWSHSNLYTRTREFDEEKNPSPPSYKREYVSEDDNNNSSGSDNETGGGGRGDNDMMGLMEFMRQTPPPARRNLSLTPLYTRNTSPCKSVQKEFNRKDMGIP